jgi:hypothetical protein
MAHHKTRRTAADERRIKVAIDSGVHLTTVATRFGMGLSTLQDLMKRRGWTKPAPAPKPKYVGRPPKPTGRNPMFLKPSPLPFTPTAQGSPVRVLQGAEFERRKAELEARDRAGRSRAMT